MGVDLRHFFIESLLDFEASEFALRQQRQDGANLCEGNPQRLGTADELRQFVVRALWRCIWYDPCGFARIAD